MKKILFPLTVLTFLALGSIEAKTDAFLFGHEDNLNILVNNRVLAKVNGKAISVFDVTKKMDLMFFRQFPQYATSVQGRFQFYITNWKHVAKDLIEKELILADATENAIPVSNGDVRQEMENLFGPNIIVNLDKIGMTHEEAVNIVKTDILLRRMVYFKVHMKAFRGITPQVVRSEYSEYAKTNAVPQSFIYQVVTIRDGNAENGKKISDQIQKQLVNQEITLQTLADNLKAYGTETTVSISEEFKHTEKEMSDAYREAVLKLEVGNYSEATAQISRANNSTVYRIFTLKDKNLGGAAPFSEVESKIRDKLQGNAADKEMTAYLTKLYRHFDVQQNFLEEFKDEDYKPFTLK